MERRIITVTDDIEAGCDEDGFYIYVQEHQIGEMGEACVVLTRPDLEKLRDAITELLEEEE